MKLKTGIIGCGKVGDFHAKAYAQLENSEFTAVCDANLERAKAFAERYNVHAYSDIAEMIQKEHLDVVSVCTPHPIHCDPAVTAAENGCNVLIEKPLASTLADCDRIIEAGDKNHVTIGTMVQRRFYRPCMRIHEAIEAGKIGKPVLGMVTMLGWRDKAYYDSDAWRGTWKGEGGGVLLNQCPHNLDLLQWICGLPCKVQAFCHEGKWHDIEVEDDVTAYLEFPEGATGVFVTSTGDAPGTNRLELTLEYGKLVYEEDRLTLHRLAENERDFCKTAKGGFDKPQYTVETVDIYGEYPQHAGVMNAFAACILHGTPLVAQGTEGIRGLTLSNAMHLSSWLGRAVALPFDEDLFLSELEKRCASSQEKQARDVVFDTKGTY